MYSQAVIFIGFHPMFSYFFLGVFLTFSGQSGPPKCATPQSGYPFVLFSHGKNMWDYFHLVMVVCASLVKFFLPLSLQFPGTIPTIKRHTGTDGIPQWVNSPAATMIPLIWVKKIVIEEVYPSSSVPLAKPVGQTQVKPSRVFNQPTYTVLGCRMHSTVLYYTVL